MNPHAQSKAAVSEAEGDPCTPARASANLGTSPRIAGLGRREGKGTSSLVPHRPPTRNAASAAEVRPPKNLSSRPQPERTPPASLGLVRARIGESVCSAESPS